MKHFSAKLNVKEDPHPIFLKPRSVPFSIYVREGIKAELKRLRNKRKGASVQVGSTNCASSQGRWENQNLRGTIMLPLIRVYK